jgi:hypothetical protein
MMAHRPLICAIQLSAMDEPSFASALREMENKLLRAIHDSKEQMLAVFCEPILAEPGQPSRFLVCLEGRLAELQRQRAAATRQE